MKIFIVVLSSFIFSTLFSQSLVVEEWVEEPEAHEFEKPLIFVEFWATWCIPCIQAMPQIDLLKEEYGTDVMFMYLSDEPAYTVHKFMKKKNKHFLSATDTKGRSLEAYKVSALPASFLLNPSGDIIWEGNPTELTSYKLKQLVQKYNTRKGNISRFYMPEKIEEKETEFSTYSQKKVTIEYAISEVENNFIEETQTNFYFNGNLVNLYSYLTKIPEKNIINQSSNTNYYSIQSTFQDKEKFRKALELWVEKELKINTEKQEELIDSYVLKPTDSMSFLPSNMYDFSENNAKYLASDMDIQIDNQSTEEMVSILNNFSDAHFEAKKFSDEKHDWNIHFGYLELTLEQLKSELGFSVEKKEGFAEILILRDK